MASITVIANNDSFVVNSEVYSQQLRIKAVHQVYFQHHLRKQLPCLGIPDSYQAEFYQMVIKLATKQVVYYFKLLQVKDYISVLITKQLPKVQTEFDQRQLEVVYSN